MSEFTEKMMSPYIHISQMANKFLHFTKDFGTTSAQRLLTLSQSKSLAKPAIVIACIALAVAAWLKLDDLEYAIILLFSYKWGYFYVMTGKILLVINLSAFCWRFLLVTRYQPAKACTNKQLPTCSVIVPAYNEGEQVLKTLYSIIQSDYPADKLQIIAIDDGSVDDTWSWIQKAAGSIGEKIETVRLAKNSGKRTALYEGFIRSSGQVLVTIDSDSIIEKNTLRNLVSPFYHDKKIGAVAGCVRILNKERGIIPRMLDVSFAFSFDFMRASQSAINTVFCTPGALAAYRRKPLMGVLHSWLHQTFLGRPVNIGEDRALTNAILRIGYHVTFQSNAVVYTNVPVSYENLCKMFLRWARSNVRETLVMASFIFRKFRQTPASGARINFLLSLMYLTVPQFLLLGAFLCILWQPDIFLIQTLFGATISSLIPASFYIMRRHSSDALWAIPYSFFWLFALSWITPYAILTANNSNWLTRDIKDVNPSPQPRPSIKSVAAA